jgi:MFS family permease
VFLSFGVVAALGSAVFLLLRPAPPLSEDALAAGGALEEKETLLWSSLPPAGEVDALEGGRSINSAEAAESPTAAAPAETGVSLYDTLRLLSASRPMQLMIPIILYNGMSLSFMFGDYAGFFASQTDKAHMLLDKSMVGYVLACFYVVNSVASYGFGRIASVVGRSWLMALAAATHVLFWALLGVFMYAVELKPDAGATYAAVFLLAALFAVGDSVWESQAPAVLQSPSFFPDELDRDAAMSNLKMWQSLGFAIEFALGFLISSYWIKLIILGCLQLLAALSLFLLHRSVRSLDSDVAANKDRGKNGERESSIIASTLWHRHKTVPLTLLFWCL